MCEVKHWLIRSIYETIIEHKKLLDLDVHENTIGHQLAVKMISHFQGWDIDVQYNRFGQEGDTKIISKSKAKFREYHRLGIEPNSTITIEELQNNPKSAPVYPDIIVHRRGFRNYNLLHIELKKCNNKELFDGWDEWKIKFFKDTFNYQYGAQVVFLTGVENLPSLTFLLRV